MARDVKVVEGRTEIDGRTEMYNINPENGDLVRHELPFTTLELLGKYTERGYTFDKPQSTTCVCGAEFWSKVWEGKHNCRKKLEAEKPEVYVSDKDKKKLAEVS